MVEQNKIDCIYNLFDSEDSTDDLLSNLCIYDVESKGVRMKVLNYEHMPTGSLLDYKNYRKLGGSVIPKDGSSHRTSKLLKLRKEPMEFASFLLKFRNTACGFRVSTEQLIDWYSMYSGKRKDNVRRLMKALIEAEILKDEFTLHKDFMINSRNRSKSDAIGDFETAGITFDILLMKKRQKENSILDAQLKEILGATKVLK